MKVYSPTRLNYYYAAALLSNFKSSWGYLVGIFGSGCDQKTDWESPHIAEQLLFSMLHLILTRNFDLILDFFGFGGPNGLFLG